MNPKVKITNTEILSKNWYVLRKITYDYQKKNGEWQAQSREAYDRGNGATINFDFPNLTRVSQSDADMITTRIMDEIDRRGGGTYR